MLGPLVDRIVDGRAVRSVEGVIRGSVGERRIPFDSLGGVCMSITVAQQKAKIVSRSAKRILSFHLLLSHARYEHRPRLLFSYSYKRGMQSLRSRDKDVRRRDKHVGTKHVRNMAAQP